MRTFNEKKAAGKHALEVASYKTMSTHTRSNKDADTIGERKKFESGSRRNGWAKHLKTTLLNTTHRIAMDKAEMHG